MVTNGFCPMFIKEYDPKESKEVSINCNETVIGFLARWFLSPLNVRITVLASILKSSQDWIPRPHSNHCSFPSTFSIVEAASALLCGHSIIVTTNP